MRVRFYEWLAGKLLVASAKLRARRMGPDDRHEIRHLGAALFAGNSDHGPECPITPKLYRYLHDATFPNEAR